MADATMDPEAVLEYKEHLTGRYEGLVVQESLLATEAGGLEGIDDTESGLIPQAAWFGPDALWTEDVVQAVETTYFHRAGEAATGSNLIEHLQETLQLYADRWRDDEESIADDMDQLTAELENWTG
ncbi:hypothetical protein LO763_17905 [Glycomyces sp. A-F 0318]|uniref:hypothetical protein n=1 Tax=Glycomyces amatae TaxID=2881355 RepID=UPI001E4911A4|nr:hypothetical protein [Glycomyces amatae]MCD0445490.1 hypothetical protein [Glycomyces amatae]